MSSAPEKLHSQLLNEDADLRDIVEEFVAELPGRLEEIKQAYADLSWDELAVLAHRLKGASGSYGYPDLSSLAAEMESGFRAQQAEDFGNWVDRFEQLVNAVKLGLNDS